MHHNLYINLKILPAELRKGIKELSQTAGICFTSNSQALEIQFFHKGQGLKIEYMNNQFVVEYGDLTDAFRALGLIKARLEFPERVNLRQTRRMNKVFVMIDVSRNAVLNMESSIQWLHFLALAGINGFMFYTEDTFEFPGEPLFGYQRGRFSCTEIKRLDDIANTLGIEMIPCIQTLGHLEKILKYDRYREIKDTDSVLLCDSEKSLDFIGRMIEAASKPYRSDRIHIGLDEAWDLGRGNYLNNFGWKKSSEIITNHLKQVLQVVRKKRLKPMMWADMFFRSLPGGEKYYGEKLTVEDMRQAYDQQVPEDIQLVYWDYYHFDKESYAEMMRKHQAINNRTPIFAPAIHQPRRFWPSTPFTEKTVRAGLESCLENSIDETIITIWGDEGMECDCFASMAWLQFIADFIYNGQAVPEETQCNLKGNTGFDFHDFQYAGSMDAFDFLEPGHYPNISRALLWENPLLGTIQAQLEGESLQAHYRTVADKLDEMHKKPGNMRLELPWRLADILADKASLPTEIRQAYLNRNLISLSHFSEQTIPMLLKKIADLKNYHKTLWLENYKPFGWETLDARYSILIGMFEHLQERLRSFIDGQVETLPELDEERLKIFNLSKDKFPHIWYSVLTPN